MHSQIETTIHDRVKELVEYARKKYPHAVIPLPEIQFNLRSKDGGKISKALNKFENSPTKFKYRVSFNPIFAQHYYNHYLCETVTHEIAHMVDDCVFGGWGHSGTWYQVMRDLGVERPKRCHEYDVNLI